MVNKKTVTAHTLVKNEARFIWYSVRSVIDYVDKILLWDTGSSDGTVEILKEIKKVYKNKVDLKLLSDVTPKEFAKVRSEMLNATKTDWFLMLDGDEVWWDDNIKKTIKFVNKYGDKFDLIVHPTINLVGDIYHYQESAAGNYNLAGRKGHYNVRAINRSIKGLSSDKPHGTWGWTDESGQMIQDRDPKKIKYLDLAYLHATYLQRAGNVSGDAKVPKRAKKRKYEIGISFPSDYYYPESFFMPRPKFVESVWEKFDINYKRKAIWQTPLRKVKRRLLPAKIGY